MEKGGLMGTGWTDDLRVIRREGEYLHIGCGGV